MATKKKTTTRKKQPAKRATTTRRAQRHKPESFRARGVAPSLTVRDIERSIAWYRDVLGFTEGERWTSDNRLHGIQLKAGNIDLMLTQDDFAKGRDRKLGEGVRVWFETVQDIDALADQIRGRGGVLDNDPQQMPWGDYAFAVTDPDGYKFTVVQL